MSDVLCVISLDPVDTARLEARQVFSSPAVHFPQGREVLSVNHGDHERNGQRPRN